MALSDMFPKKPKPKGFESGPPSADNAGEGRSPGGGDEGDMLASEMKDKTDGNGYGDHESMAADDIADLCGVAPEDRGDFAAALKEYVHSCVASVLAEKDGETAGGDTGEY